MPMKLPSAASDGPEPLADGPPSYDEAYLMNPYHGKELLTFYEALDLINIISGELMADGRNR
jgi:hypothetical protein